MFLVSDSLESSALSLAIKTAIPRDSGCKSRRVRTHHCAHFDLGSVAMCRLDWNDGRPCLPLPQTFATFDAVAIGQGFQHMLVQGRGHSRFQRRKADRNSPCFEVVVEQVQGHGNQGRCADARVKDRGKPCGNWS